MTKGIMVISDDPAAYSEESSQYRKRDTFLLKGTVHPKMYTPRFKLLFTDNIQISFVLLHI